MRSWLQRDDVPHPMKLTVLFVVLLAAHIGLALACLLFLSSVTDIPASARPSVFVGIAVFSLAVAGTGTYVVHRALSDR